jgi:hypothetical protein
MKGSKASGNRTKLTRDAALLSGKTCIACGAPAVSRVGEYPVCPRHCQTVSAPAPDQRWKKNVRDRHQRIPTRGSACGVCGRRDNLTRHHDWAGGAPGHPPRPIILCKGCHTLVEKGPQKRTEGAS